MLSKRYESTEVDRRTWLQFRLHKYLYDIKNIHSIVTLTWKRKNV